MHISMMPDFKPLKSYYKMLNPKMLRQAQHDKRYWFVILNEVKNLVFLILQKPLKN